MQFTRIDGYKGKVAYAFDQLWIQDTLNGFDQNIKSWVLDQTVDIARHKSIKSIYTCYVFDRQVRDQYPEIQFFYDQTMLAGGDWNQFKNINTHRPVDFDYFLCSFNGSAEVGRKLLVSILEKMNWFDHSTCTKNFSYTHDIIDGHVDDLSNSPDLHRKFFTGVDLEGFFQKKITIDYKKFSHVDNFFAIESAITKSFVNLIGETHSVNYYPVFTEKWLHSLVSRGLFVCFAPPNWHKNLHDIFGFHKYDRIFQYDFDIIANPIERLLHLISMLSPFSVLSKQDRHDLYLLEQDHVEYNYDHFFSGRYLNNLAQYENAFCT